MEREVAAKGVFLVQINISTRHGHLSEATQGKIGAKLERLPRLFERLTAIEVTVDLEHKDSPTVDLRISAEHKHDFVATEQAGELMASIDGCIHKVEQQLRKYKQKVQDHHKTPGLRQQGLAGQHEPAGD
jgi:putative sigma-54 modulation protein